VIDIDALNTALEQGWLRAAALDVTDPEPMRADHPLLRHEPESLIVTTHIASTSIQTRHKMAEMVAANVLAGVEGEPLPNSALEDAEIR